MLTCYEYVEAHGCIYCVTYNDDEVAEDDEPELSVTDDDNPPF